MKPQPFTYYGVRVEVHGPNTSGMRYVTSVLSDVPKLRSDTKALMKEMIRRSLSPERLRQNRGGGHR